MKLTDLIILVFLVVVVSLLFAVGYGAYFVITSPAILHWLGR